MISYSAESCNPEFRFRNCTIEGDDPAKAAQLADLLEAHKFLQ